MILLDTNALLWLERSHPRSRALERAKKRLYISPASLLEIQVLAEIGRIRLPGSATASVLAEGSHWLLDDPPAAAWFDRALELGWTRDPFDRLLIAHAQLRGWRLATGDRELIERLGAGSCVPL